MACDFKIDLTTKVTFDQVAEPNRGHYVEIVASGAVYDGVAGDANIFVYQRESKTPADGTYGSFFSAVATPNDMAEIINTTEPVTTEPQPYLFRLNYVRAYFRSRHEAEFALEAIKADVKLLMDALKMRCAHLSDPTVVTITGA